MFFAVSICLFLGKILAQEDNLFEDFNDTFNTTDSIITNNITEDDFTNITLERIIKPIGIGKLIDYPTTQSSQNLSNSNKEKRDFRPSPHLGTYYDLPTTSPYPEAKHSSNFLINKIEKSPWTDKIQLTTESSWTTKIKFPTEKPEIVTASDRS